MFFTAAFALTAASLAMAQGVTINSASLTQCAQSTLNFAGSTGPYYVALLNAANPCGSDAYAEYYDVTGSSVDYFVNLASGTSVQPYVVDASGQEYWGSAMTVGDGDGSCLGLTSSTTDSATSSSTDSSTSTSSTPSSSASLAPTTYIPPNANTVSSNTGSTTGSNTGTGNVADNNDTPANAADDTTTSGASTITASATLIFGAFAAAVALL